MTYELKCLRFKLTEKEMFRFLLKQVVETKTNHGEPFTIQMSHHSVKHTESKTIIDVSYGASVGKDGESFATENGLLISVDCGANFLGSVDLKVFKGSEEE